MQQVNGFLNLLISYPGNSLWSVYLVISAATIPAFHIAASQTLYFNRTFVLFAGKGHIAGVALVQAVSDYWIDFNKLNATKESCQDSTN